ncbi:hypothetical protein D3C73_1105690 [compost metagenome]
MASRLGFGTEIGVHQHQAIDPLWRRQRQARAPHATDRQAHQGDPVDVQVVEQRQCLAGNVVKIRGAFGQAPGLTVPPQVQGDHPVMRRQRGNLRRPHGLVPQVAAGQQYRRAGTLVNVMKGLSVNRYEGHRLVPLPEREEAD